jgi:PhnB protein
MPTPTPASSSANKDASASPKPKAVSPIPAGFHTVTPHLICAGASDAIEFYKQAFGAKEVSRMPTPDGKLMHAQITIGDSQVMLFDENLQWGSLGPKALKGTPVVIHLFVPDVDAVFARAVKAGGTVKLAVTDMFWGDRYGQIEDPWGHLWSIATHTRDLTPAEIAEGMKAMCG